ncbi:hypothetical protein GCM10027612_16400 [Microbispora bryophytorum subsp. camponoti]
MIVGSAFDTTVDDRIATNNPSIRPESASRISRCVIAGAAVPGGVSRVIAFAIEVLPRVIKLSFPKQLYADRCFGQPYGHGPAGARNDEGPELAGQGLSVSVRAVTRITDS